MSKKKSPHPLYHVVELDPKHVALYKKGDKVKVYKPGTPFEERKEYTVSAIDYVTGKLHLWEVVKEGLTK